MQIHVIKRYFLLLNFAILMVSSPLALSAEWYENFSFKINDPFDLTLFHAVPGDERIMGGLRLGHRSVTAGEVYAIFSQSELQRIEAAGDKKYVHYENVLDKNKAAFWKKMFAKRGVIKRIPWEVSVASIAIGSFMNPVATGVAAGLSATTLLIDYMLEHGDSVTKEAIELSSLMVEGGKFTQYLTIRRDQDKHPYVHSDVFYQVQVQKQWRAYLIYSSVHAVKVE